MSPAAHEAAEPPGRPAATAPRPHGKLKVFFGAAPGVGKTYAMLEAARAARDAGIDVVVGIVETHGRDETRWLLEGLRPLEVLPRRKVEHRGRVVEELDIDAAVRRRPALLLVDELAHGNVEGSRHAKRWQDVTELLGAGIDVWTTLDVQHLEGLNDVVAQITKVRMRETVPDGVLDRADEIELVDLPPDALLERLAEGKLYADDEAARAAAGFFERGNLLALRELALRRTAERVDTDVLAWRKEQGIATTWPVAEHVLVCVGPSPVSADLVRAARRMAAGLRARWTAVTVDTPASAPLSEDDRVRVNRHLRLAEDLGAQVATLAGLRPAESILEFARKNNVTRIILGKPTHARWRDFVFGSLLESLVRGSGEVDVHVIRGDPAEERAREIVARRRWQGELDGLTRALGVVAVATAICFLMYGHFDLANLVMVYLLGIVFVAYRQGRVPAMAASILSVASFDFCFVLPRFTFAVAEARYLVTFAIMLLVGFVVSGLTERVRRQADAAQLRELRTAALYALTRELAAAKDAREVVEVTTSHARAAADSQVTVLHADESGLLAATGDSDQIDEHERGVAAWVLEHREPAGLGTTTLPGGRALHIPLASGPHVLGVLAVVPAEPGRLEDPEQRHLLHAFAQQTAMALARVRLGEEARVAAVRAEREELLSSLLSSVSHDLRTPLAAITGAATSLLDNDRVAAHVRRELLSTIAEESDRLNRLVSNLLEMTRLESGSLVVRKEWTPLEEVIGTALDRLGATLHGRTVTLDLPGDLPLAPLDGVLMGQVFVNLLENAAKHTPGAAAVEVHARAEGDEMVIDVADRGPGLPPGAEERVFEKFYSGGGAAGGAGLGGAICRGIVVAHGGTISAQARPGGGAVFRIRLPLEGGSPDVPAERASERHPAAGEIAS